MKIIALFLLSLLFSCQGGKEVTPKSEEDKTFYAMGAMLGQRLATLSLSDKELSMVVQGFRDASREKELQVKGREYHLKIQQTFRERIKIKAKQAKKEGVTYMEKFLKEEGAQKTESGMAYKITKKGSGKSPKATDLVRVHYHGTLVNGKVFDSSVERGNPVNFPLNQVIKCWTEGVQKLNKGSKATLVCPSNLAYGESGAPPRIPGGATLIFEVELLEILPPDKKSKKSRKSKRRSKGKHKGHKH